MPAGLCPRRQKTVAATVDLDGDPDVVELVQGLIVADGVSSSALGLVQREVGTGDGHRRRRRLLMRRQPAAPRGPRSARPPTLQQPPGDDGGAVPDITEDDQELLAAVAGDEVSIAE